MPHVNIWFFVLKKCVIYCCHLIISSFGIVSAINITRIDILKINVLTANYKTTLGFHSNSISISKCLINVLQFSIIIKSVNIDLHS